MVVTPARRKSPALISRGSVPIVFGHHLSGLMTERRMQHCSDLLMIGDYRALPFP